MHARVAWLAAGLLLASGGMALAQTGTGMKRPPDSPSANPAPAPPPPGARRDTPGGSASNGVIRPPQAVDPGLAQPPPAHGAAPGFVIPPPGTPGGNPKLQPK